MSEQKENEGVFVGIVHAAVDSKFNAAGKCQAKLQVKRTEVGDWGSKDIGPLTFSLFGKPAEDLTEKNPAIGTAVRVTYRLGSWEAKNKEGALLGFHNVALNAWRVDVRSVQDTKPAEETIDF